MSKQIVIYGLVDPREPGEVRYIGKTNNLTKRLYSHIYLARTNREDTHKARWIRKILSQGFPPIMIELSQVDYDNWQEYERRAIAEGRAAGLPLTNTCEGGRGVDAPRTEEWCRRIGESRSGIPVPDEVKARIRQTLLAKNTHCKNGHKWTEGSTAYATKDGRIHRKCKICSAKYQRDRRRKKGLIKGRRKTHCRFGHPLSGDNLRILRRKRVGRNGIHEEHICRECVRTRNRKAKKRAKS